MLKFKKRNGRTISTGRITAPKEFDSVLDRSGNCPIGSSVDIHYIMPDGFPIHGRLYQSENNSTTYYQFYIVESGDKKTFKNYTDSSRELFFKYDPQNKILIVKQYSN